ncbi:cytochrome P450 [Favolaschia claudopus]|uniref:Cytochrome P450 n=1 Tax=Favolaschia claudopus TaxID=2862362 RepID=A0AAW0DCZ9_9AGAR
MDNTRFFTFTAATLAISYLLFRTLRHTRQTIDEIRGPLSSSWVFGHMRELFFAPKYGNFEFQWLRKYGAVYQIKGPFGESRLVVADPAAMQYILNTPAHFRFSPSFDHSVRLLYPEQSVIRAHGEDHQRLRTALNPGFSAAAVRSYLPVFLRAAQSLTDQFDSRLGEITNVSPIFGRTTLGTVSEAILGYTVEDLGDEYTTNNLEILSFAANQSAVHIVADVLTGWIPNFLRDAAIKIPAAPFTTLNRAQCLASNIASRVIEEKVNAASQGVGGTGGFYGELVDQQRLGGGKSALTRDEIIAQTSILLNAGQDTTATTLALGLTELAQDIEFQEKLRTEVHSSLGGAGGGGEIAYDRMPLLNAFIKESLRMYPAEPITERMAVRDVVLPLTESITTVDGKQLSRIPIRKGQIVMLSVASYQRLASRWGEDADSFRPSRWLEREGVPGGEAMGPYANLLSFFGGPRTCLGWRFALLEMQVFICELVGKFQFSLPPQGAAGFRYGGTLLPTLPDGQKGALLEISRVT